MVPKYIIIRRDVLLFSRKEADSTEKESFETISNI